QLHTGVVAGQATFGPPSAFTYTGGGADDLFAGNNRIVDLDNDGWNDVVIADVDPEIAGCGRRAHIFRNLGNAPNVTLQEQLVGGAVCGIPTAMLSGTFDVAVFDVNGDGWKDMVLGRCTGTQVWINQPPLGIQFTVVGGMPTVHPPGTPLTLDVVATGTGGVVPQTGTGRLWYSTNGAPFQAIVMADLGPGLYRGTLPAMANCADSMRVYFAANGQNAVTYTHPSTAPATTLELIAAIGTTPVLLDHNEGVVSGWTVANGPTLTSGAWQVAAPNGTVNGTIPAAPSEDAEPGPVATKCQVTQNGLPGGTAGAADVDGGPTDLVSPLLDFTGSDGTVSYRRWFYSSTSEDVLLVQVTNDGTNWTTVETVPASGNNQWLTRSFRIGQFVTPNATVQVRFRANDQAPASIVEAAVDVFRAEAFVCTPCQLQVPLATNGNAFLSVCGADMTTPGALSTVRVVGMPPNTSGLLLFDLPLLPTPWLGGTLLSPAPVILGPLFADASGSFTAAAPLGGLLPPGWFLHTQVVYVAPPLPSGVGQTNAVHLQW
ncbi:MAG: VCBS repeat-containing protein, partial [Planctomycetes bacterium]|nr:VCBS repeat-containing protein [Planctomycetota bacterium]